MVDPKNPSSATRHFDVLIVGGGHGGAQAAIALRQQGFDGSIGVISDEAELPYERPPLSKEYFSGEKSAERIRIRPAAFWEDRGIVFLLGEKVVAVEPAAYEIGTASGQAIGYKKLIWATGGNPRKLNLPGSDLDGIFTLRTRVDADKLKMRATGAENIVIVGGGYIGLEAASALAKIGKKVVLLEVLDRVLERVAGEELSRYIEGEHAAHGVDVRLGTGLAGIDGTDHLAAVRLSNGETLACDLLLVGIGIIPATEPLIAAGAETAAGGVMVDEQCRTSIADVYAVGDCAAHRNAFADCAALRLESVQNAHDMAVVAVKSIMGVAEPYIAVPWFWSNQFDVKVQTVGLSLGYDSTAIRGNPVDRSFSVIYFRGARVVALDCVNATRDYVQGKALVLANARIDRSLITDTSIQLKELLVGQNGA